MALAVQEHHTIFMTCKVYFSRQIGSARFCTVELASDRWQLLSSFLLIYFTFIEANYEPFSLQWRSSSLFNVIIEKCKFSSIPENT